MKVKAHKVHYRYNGSVDKMELCEVEFAINDEGTTLYIINGGIQGTERLGLPVSKYAYNSIEKHGWIAYSGITGATPSLTIKAEEMKKVMKHFNITYDNRTIVDPYFG